MLMPFFSASWSKEGYPSIFTIGKLKMSTSDHSSHTTVQRANSKIITLTSTLGMSKLSLLAFPREPWLNRSLVVLTYPLNSVLSTC